MAVLTMSDLESSRGSGNGKEWVISRTPSLSTRPRRDPETNFGRDSWQCFTILSTAFSGKMVRDEMSCGGLFLSRYE